MFLVHIEHKLELDCTCLKYQIAEQIYYYTCYMKLTSLVFKNIAMLS